MSEKLSDLMPQGRVVENPEDELQRELEIAEQEALKENEFIDDTQTLQGLGAPLEIGGMFLPEPTTGVIALLDVIKSPFIVATDESDVISIHDFYKAIYIICNGKSAVKDVFILRKCQEKIQRAESIAEKSPDYFAVYLSVTQALSEKESEFEAKCFDFATELGLIDIENGIGLLSEYINVCWGGFAMLPSTQDGEKKTSDLI